MANIPYHITAAGVAHGFVPFIYLKNVYSSFIVYSGNQIFHQRIFFPGLDRFYYKDLNESASSIIWFYLLW